MLRWSFGALCWAVLMNEENFSIPRAPRNRPETSFLETPVAGLLLRSLNQSTIVQLIYIIYPYYGNLI